MCICMYGVTTRRDIEFLTRQKAIAHSRHLYFIVRSKRCYSLVHVLLRKIGKINARASENRNDSRDASLKFSPRVQLLYRTVVSLYCQFETVYTDTYIVAKRESLTPPPTPLGTKTRFKLNTNKTKALREVNTTGKSSPLFRP